MANQRKRAVKPRARRTPTPCARTTRINGEEFVLASIKDVEGKIRDKARDADYGKFDVKDLDKETYASEGEIKVGGNYKVLPRAQMGC